MSNATNPYAAPASNVAPAPAPGADCWREGKFAVVRRGGDLPQRCVRCNAEAPAAKKRTYYWHSSYIYLLILLNLIIYAIVAVIVRKSEKLSPALCREHGRQRALFITLVLVLIVACFAFMMQGAAHNQPVFFAVGGLGLLGALVLGRKASLPSAALIDKQLVKLRGCDPRFLDSLPAGEGRLVLEKQKA